jgi:uncharacterized membrane protein YfcA
MPGVASTAQTKKVGVASATGFLLLEFRLPEAINLAPVLDILTQARTWELVVVVAVAGLVRGFSGFGGGLIFIPLASALVGPKLAIPIFYLIDLCTATPYGLRMLPKASMREISPLLAGSWLAAPIGGWILVSIEPDALRWASSLLVLLMVALLASGWRYGGEPKPLLSFGLGGTGGILGTATGISGPIIIAYFLGSRAPAELVRANIMAFYALAALGTDVILLWKGLFSLEALVYAALGAPLYAAGLTFGSRVFGRSTDKFYRQAAFVLITFSAISGMPPVSALIR